MPVMAVSTSLSILVLLSFASQAYAFGAGYVARGSHAHGSNFRHGDILMAVYFLHHVHSTNVRKIYFGNWLRDFSQLVDKKAIELVPEPILRAVVAVFAHIQFGYSTGDFEVTPERLGCYRPEEHIDNPKGYDVPAQTSGTDSRYSQLRSPVTTDELQIQKVSGMKNYIANQETAPGLDTSRDFIEKQLIAAVACGRSGNSEAYIHLGAALHTLEDFVAHSNWLELCLQMLGEESEALPFREEMKNVFAFTGGAARVQTKRGTATPLVTGTFGALDLYQSLLGEIDDKLSAMSIPGLKKRMKGPEDDLSAATKSLISLLKGAGGTDLIDDISNIGETANSEPGDWGKLNETPGMLWDLIKPILRVRDKVVQWVYDHLTVDIVANAIAAISAAIDKFVYIALGVVLSPVLKDISAVLAEQSEELLIKDQEARLVHGKDNIFDDMSTATDPTHSQLCKDHYGHPLNELAGLVAVQITTSAIKKIVELWQPNSKAAVKPVIDTILATLHHPWNYSKESDIESLMVAQVFNWSSRHGEAHDFLHKQILEGLDKSHQAALNLGEASQVHHHHVSKITDAYADPAKTAPVGVSAGDHPSFSQGKESQDQMAGLATKEPSLQQQREGFIHPLQEQPSIGDPSSWNQTSSATTGTASGVTAEPTIYGSENVTPNQPIPKTGTTNQQAPTVHQQTTTSQDSLSASQQPHLSSGTALPSQTLAVGSGLGSQPTSQATDNQTSQQRDPFHTPAAPHAGAQAGPQSQYPSAGSHQIGQLGAAQTPAHRQDPSATDTDSSQSQPLIMTHLTRNITSALRPSSTSAKPPPEDLDADSLLPQIAKIFETEPSSDVPNPIDHALTLLPGLPILDIFEGIEISEIIAAPGMGVVLKDGVIRLRMADEEKLEQRQKTAHRTHGGWEERSVKELVEMLEAPGRMRGPSSAKNMLGVGDGAGAKGRGSMNESGDAGEEDDGPGSKMGKLMGKLKLRRSSGQ